MTARYADPGHTSIAVERDGQTLFVPVDPLNADYAALFADNTPIAPYAPPPVTADDIRGEARRRILAAIPDWKQANMTARAVELADKQSRGESLTDAEMAERGAIDAAWGWIKSVRAASDTLESDPPADFADDAHWPSWE